ncbi:hypothetical protein FIU87_20075 [Bacillus sp. THAF10]|nr:hypothetical protein FIU87_20075 [Bacillus sp. THAF10]
METARVGKAGNMHLVAGEACSTAFLSPSSFLGSPHHLLDLFSPTPLLFASYTPPARPFFSDTAPFCVVHTTCSTLFSPTLLLFASSTLPARPLFSLLPLFCVVHTSCSTFFFLHCFFLCRPHHLLDLFSPTPLLFASSTPPARPFFSDIASFCVVHTSCSTFFLRHCSFLCRPHHLLDLLMIRLSPQTKNNPCKKLGCLLYLSSIFKCTWYRGVTSIKCLLRSFFTRFFSF